jgi:integrase
MLRKYKLAKGYTGKTGDPNEEWYAYYSFINPNTGKFKFFKVKEGINYIHSLEEKNNFLQELIQEINKSLKAGFNPFALEVESDKVIEEVKAEIELAENPKSPTLIKAFQEFLEVKNAKGLAKPTIEAYTSYIGKFENYLYENKQADLRLDSMDTSFIKEMLSWLNNYHKWNGTTYNNHLNFWVTLLNWFSKAPRKWILRDEFAIGVDGEIEQKSSKPMKHQYFGDTVAEKVKIRMKAHPELMFMCKFIYFSCMRPDEIRHLRIENVDISGRYIKIVGKTSSRTVPICDELALMLKSLNLERYPAGYYVIGRQGRVTGTMHSENWFSGIFREQIRKPLGLSDNFTMYGWKHTRVVDLLNAGYSDTEIMNLTGHRDTTSYDKYKRELVNHIQTRLRGKTIGW